MPTPDALDELANLWRDDAFLNTRLVLWGYAFDPSWPEGDRAAGAEASPAEDFGRSPDDPVPVNTPLGELIYLSRLRDEAGRAVLFHRLGARAAPRTRHIVSVYETVTADGGRWDILYLDPCHRRRSRLAPSGYRSATAAEDRPRATGIGLQTADFPNDLPRLFAGAPPCLFGFRLPYDEATRAVASRTFRRPAAHKAAIARLSFVSMAAFRPRLDEDPGPAPRLAAGASPFRADGSSGEDERRPSWLRRRDHLDG